MVCGNFCKMNGSGDISSFGVFTVLKIVLHNKSINETCLKKDEENPAPFWRPISG